MNQPTFEQLLRELESVVSALESNDLPLEETLSTYQRGVALAKEGHARLLEAERRIEEVTRTGEKKVLDVDALMAGGENG